MLEINKESIDEHDTDLWWCHSDIQLVDGLTKRRRRAETWRSCVRRDGSWCRTSRTPRQPRNGHRWNAPFGDKSDIQELGRQDGILTLFHGAGHEILTWKHRTHQFMNAQTNARRRRSSSRLLTASGHLEQMTSMLTSDWKNNERAEIGGTTNSSKQYAETTVDDGNQRLLR